MSDAIRIAKEAPKHIEGLLADMFAANADDNRVCLGGVYSGQQYIQIQLVVTSNPAALLDDNSGEEDGGIEPVAGPVHNQLTTHWLAARAEFIAAAKKYPRHRDIENELLALGAVRSVYWLALGQGATTLAREMSDWWSECAPLHGLGETIK